MYTPNQLYDYLRYYCQSNKKNAVVLNSLVNGSKDLKLMSTMASEYISGTDDINFDYNHLKYFRETSGCFAMLDQEPLDINAYHETSVQNASDSFSQVFEPAQYISTRSIGVYTPLFTVSDYNSDDVKTLTSEHMTPVHFWSNAFLSRYWFSQYELLQKNYSNTNTHRIGCYIRDTSGTRAYRKPLLSFIQHNKEIYCPDASDVSSDASASIPWLDHTKFNIQIVAETLFKTQSIHLTEKVFKPIVMHQGFILFAPPNSLEFMRSYGFKTFTDCWDESYDTIMNEDLRFQKLTELITSLSTMDTKSYNALLIKMNKIVKHNRKHFYSDAFKQLLVNELHRNLEFAFAVQEQNFNKLPGGTLFYYHDLYFKITGEVPTTKIAPLDVSRKRALEYIYTKSKIVGDAVVKKYGHLL
jgi:hypothetical protein